MQNVLNSVIAAVFFVKSPVGGKITHDVGMPEVLTDDSFVHGQIQRVTGHKHGGKIFPAARRYELYAVNILLDLVKVLGAVQDRPGWQDEGAGHGRIPARPKDSAQHRSGEHGQE